jgi:hypothetical protein
VSLETDDRDDRIIASIVGEYEFTLSGKEYYMAGMHDRKYVKFEFIGIKNVELINANVIRITSESAKVVAKRESILQLGNQYSGTSDGDSVETNKPFEIEYFGIPEPSFQRGMLALGGIFAVTLLVFGVFVIQTRRK